MSQDTLNRLRLIVPGALMYLVLPPLFRESLSVEFLRADIELGSAVLIFLLGALYVAFSIRNLAWRPWLDIVNGNIKDKLLTHCAPDPRIVEVADQLRPGRPLMNVFYGFVDNDQTLLELAKRVRFNGLLWTSAIDVMIIAGASSVLYLIRSLPELDTLTLSRTGEIHHFGIALALAIIAVLMRYVLVPLLTQKHVSLSNDQLEFMRQTYGNEICERIRERADAL